VLQQAAARQKHLPLHTSQAHCMPATVNSSGTPQTIKKAELAHTAALPHCVQQAAAVLLMCGAVLQLYTPKRCCSLILIVICTILVIPTAIIIALILVIVIVLLFLLLWILLIILCIALFYFFICKEHTAGQRSSKQVEHIAVRLLPAQRCRP
jgi:hypothetical protein